MDWGEDAPIILPAVNRVLGQEVRAVEHLHCGRSSELMWRSETVFFADPKYPEKEDGGKASGEMGT